MSMRTLEFPEDASAGLLEIRSGDYNAVFRQAQGRVQVDRNAHVSLYAGVPLAGIDRLRSHDLQRVQLPKKDPIDADLHRLAHLHGLRALYSSKGRKLTDHGLKALAAMRDMRDLNLYWSAVTDAGLV